MKPLLERVCENTFTLQVVSDTLAGMFCRHFADRGCISYCYWWKGKSLTNTRPINERFGRLSAAEPIDLAFVNVKLIHGRGKGTELIL